MKAGNGVPALQRVMLAPLALFLIGLCGCPFFKQVNVYRSSARFLFINWHRSSEQTVEKPVGV